ncbi:unnamed protein product [Lactuca saligna]|uniref:Bifunctional inhibitor/plant lipid transfer protein/seed storage helical domain-containing protein n=1 Tax=Lactuca saligna TaxID=75948 RepID=A0AA35Y3Z2_LACSI|nr:unnamed protein product [Lactuca saligna]
MDTCTTLVITLLAITVITVKCQITTPCTLSMITGFTPCVNYLTGSSANGRSPSASCCDAMESLMTKSMDCTCLIVTGNVPFSLPNPINQGLAISLPQACNSESMALQCKASGVSLPPPGPMLFAPPPPKAIAPITDSPEYPPSPSVLGMIAMTPTETTMEASINTLEASAPTPVTRLGPRVTPKTRPLVTTALASNRLSISSTIVLLVILANYYV